MEKTRKTIKVINKGGQGDAVYFFGGVGAAIFYIHQASGFGEVIVALLKAFVWPAYLVHKLLGL